MLHLNRIGVSLSALLFVTTVHFAQTPAATTSSPKAHELSIGDAKRKNLRLRLAVGELLDLHRGKKTTVDALVRSKPVRKAQFLYLGESHANVAHHALQAAVIRALADRGRRVLVGMEMFERSVQPVLDEWSQGKLSEEAFILKSHWYLGWRQNYALYKPIFDVAKEKRLPLVALNLPRTLVNKVARGGLESLTADERAQLPAEIDLRHEEHRTLIRTMLTGHSGDASFERMYAAQVVWDVSMADAALRYWREHRPPKKSVFVILAGSGHVMYGQGINARLHQQLAVPFATIVGLEIESKTQAEKDKGECGETVSSASLCVSRSIADFALGAASSEETPAYPAFGATLEKAPDGSLRARLGALSTQGVLLPLKRGDQLVRVDDRNFDEVNALMIYLATKRFSDTVKLVIEREGKPERIEFKLEKPTR